METRNNRYFYVDRILTGNDNSTVSKLEENM